MTAIQQQFLNAGLTSQQKINAANSQLAAKKAVTRLEERVSEALKSAQRSGSKADWARYAQLRNRLPRGLRSAH